MSSEPFEITLQCRGYEVGPGMTATPHVLLRWFEHLRWEMARCGEGSLANLFTDGYGAVVAAQRMELLKEVSIGAKLRGTLFVSRVGHTSMEITHELRLDTGGDLMARNVMTGVYLSPERRPTRLPEGIRALVVPDAGRSVGVPPVPDAVNLAAPYERTLTVRAAEIDFMNHVNQSNYLAWATDALAQGRAEGSLGEAAGRWVHGVALSYDKQAVQGDALALRAWPIGGSGFGVWISRAEQTLCRVRIEVG